MLGESHSIQDEKVENVGMQDRRVEYGDKVGNAQTSVMTVK